MTQTHDIVNSVCKQFGMADLAHVAEDHRASYRLLWDLQNHSVAQDELVMQLTAELAILKEERNKFAVELARQVTR